MNDIKTTNAFTVLEKQNIHGSQAQSVVENAEKLFNLVPNIYNKKESNVGLLVGKVQSGKTSVMISSAALAFENGHNCVIALLSDTELLLNQNYERIKETFAPFENVHVTTVCKDGDFYGLSKEEFQYLHNSNEKLFICSLKHRKRITDVVERLKGTGFDEDYILIFDDEGDDISQNTASPNKKFGHDEEGNFIEKAFSATNEAIKIFKSFFKHAAYVSVTATPESIIMLQGIQHLSPDFVLTTPPGKGYCGLQYFHAEHRDKLIKVIDDDPEDVNLDKGIPDGLKSAVAHFFAGCVYRLRKNTSRFNHSMMVHASRLVVDHSIMTNKIRSFIEQINDGLKYGRNISTKFLERVNNELITISDKESPITASELKTVMDKTKINCINGKAEVKNIKKIMSILPFHIFVGGDLLDRGVTIDGLAVVYIVRESKIAQMDTLLQRARWFGYKINYIETCKVYLTSNLDDQFLEMVPVEQSIWDMLSVCSEEKIAPRDYDFELDMDTSIIVPTSRSKASYENVLVGLRVEQRHVMLNATYNQSNYELMNTLKICHSQDIVDMKYGPLIHKKLVITVGEVLSILKDFKFSSEDSMCNYESFLTTIRYLKYKDSDLMDILFMQRSGGIQERSTIKPNTNEIIGLLQGHSASKTPDDPDYYPGDRYLVGERPMLQIHDVTLKNDVVAIQNGDIKIHKGNKVLMLAWLFPQKDYMKMVIKKKNLDE